MENKNFSEFFREMQCYLPVFYIVALGPAVSLELFASRAYVASYHAYHIYPLPVFLRRRRSFPSRKLHFLDRRSYVYSINLIKLKLLEFGE